MANSGEDCTVGVLAKILSAADKLQWTPFQMKTTNNCYDSSGSWWTSMLIQAQLLTAQEIINAIIFDFGLCKQFIFMNVLMAIK